MKRSFLLVIAVLPILWFAHDARGQWVQSLSLNGGNVTCFAKSGSNLFAGTYPGGVFRSTDNGASWAAVNNGITNDLVTAMAASGSNLFVATDAGYVYLSTDQGANWLPVDTATGGAGMGGPNAFFVVGPNVLFSIDGVMISRSTDTGQSWTWITDARNCSSIVKCGTLLIGDGSYGGIARSTDSGATWKSSPPGNTDTGFSVMAGSGGLLLAQAYLSTSGGILLSTDTGATWVVRDTGIADGYTGSLSMLGSNFFALTPSGIFRSSDSGTTWKLLSISVDTNINNLSVIGGDLFAGTTAGAFRSTDSGASWTQEDSGFSSIAISAIAMNGSYIYAGTSNDGLFISSDSGTSWGLWWTLSPYVSSNIISVATNDAYVLVGTNSGLLPSEDSGQIWDSEALLNENVRAVAVMGSGPTGSLLFAANAYGVATPIFDGYIGDWEWPDLDFSDSLINSLTVNGTDLYAGTADSGIFFSADSAITWSNIGLINQDILSLLANGTNLFAGTYGSGIFLTTNNGANWTSINNGLTDSVIHSLAISGTKLFAATDSGVFLSTDMGASWSKTNKGLTTTAATAIAANETNVFAGTSGAGLWRRPLSDFAGGGVSLTAGEQILFSSYPNPVNSKTTIMLSPSQSGFAKIFIANILGTEVAQIYSGVLVSGLHSYTWDATEALQGTYECVLEMNGHVWHYPIVIAR